MDYEELLKRAKKSAPRTEAGSRFEVPRAAIKQTKRQTTIRNFGDIAKQLRRDAAHIARFLFRELAVPGSLSGGELVLQGRVAADMIDRRIEEYAREFVLCAECGKPDTNMHQSGRIVTIKCEACGASRTHGV